MPRNPKDPGCQSADGCGCTAETPAIRIGTGRTHNHNHDHAHGHAHDHAYDHAHDHDHDHDHDHADASCVVCDVSPAQASPRPGYLRIRVLGLDCAEEVATLRRALAGLTDPERIEFNTLAGLMDVPEPAEAGAIVAAVARTGMRAVVVRGGEAPLSRWQRSRLSWLAGASGVATVVGLAIQVAGGEGVMAAVSHVGAHDVPAAGIVSYAIAVASGLYVVLPKAWYAARTLRPDMNLLMTLAVVGAIGLGEWLEAATVAFLFALSLALESWSVGRARSAVEKLLALAPAQVEVQREGRWIRVDPGAVAIGERILVRAGERVGLDGQIVHGNTTVDQAPITGESAPVERGEGDEVYAGTINGSGVIEVRTTALATDTTLARIIAMVGEARRDRSDAERWVERFARWYTPLVLGAAVLVAVLPPLLLGGLWTEWFYRALVLLVIGCPCALVISTPVAVVAGLAAAARHGVLVKSGRLLEVPARIKAVAFDKTGTLTEASLGVLTVVPAAGTQRNELVDLAAAISSRGTHPAARAIVRLAEQEQRQIVHASGVQNLPGRGASGQVAGRDVWVGSWRLAHERGAEAEPPDADASTTRVYVGVGAVLLGFFELGDTVRSTAVEAISRLRDVRIGHIVMLSGDQPGPAKAVGRQVGIDDVRAALLPADKLAAIEAIERDIGPVAMVGDGVNDAPALARASLGIAMGALGTDVAIETADVALMSDDPTRIAWLVEHSRRTLAIIHQNTVFALGIKAVFVVATMLGAASMWGAIAADTGASLLVVLNALRLLRAGGR